MQQLYGERNVNPFKYNVQPACVYGSVSISNDTVHGAQEASIIIGNHKVIASATAHPFGICMGMQHKSIILVQY